MTIVASWVLVFLFVHTINATSVVMERARQGPPVDTWEPFVWEYSSGIATLLLVPLILRLDRRMPMRDGRWRLPALLHVAATVPFSLLHVGMMVGMRKIVYALLGQQYLFGNIALELLYEYRKDFVTYFLILATFYAWRGFLARQRGARYDGADSSAAGPLFLIRDRGRMHRIAAAEIDWIEAAGNYVLLHVGAATHPLRDTMKGIEERLGDDFCRVHRSTVVNLAYVDRTLPSSGGELFVRLRDGTELKCSRMLKDRLLQQLERRAVPAGTPHASEQACAVDGNAPVA